jgi:hypothetical protein
VCNDHASYYSSCEEKSNGLLKIVNAHLVM